MSEETNRMQRWGEAITLVEELARPFTGIQTKHMQALCLTLAEAKAHIISLERRVDALELALAENRRLGENR